MSIASVVHRVAQTPIRILLISGSPRAEDNCPDEKSKSRKICEQLMQNPPPNTVFLDLAVDANQKVQPCKGCVSTAAPHCHYRITDEAHGCSCYDPGSTTEPDLLHNADVYRRLEACDGFMLVTPVNWYSVPSQVKSMFDRLVCINGGNPYYELTGKDKRLSRRLEILPEWNLIRRNHLENRSAAFFVYGDYGADEIGNDGFPKILRNRNTYKLNEEALAAPPKLAVMPIVMQLRYSGINVEDEHIVGSVFGAGLPYGVNNLTFPEQSDIFSQANKLATEFSLYVANSVLQSPPSNPDFEKQNDTKRINLQKLKLKVMSTSYPDDPT
jgi:hypothetical protein